MQVKTPPESASVYAYTPIRGIRKISAKDRPLIEKWYTARGHTMPKNGTLSDLGYIVDNCVVGWLYLTNSSLCFIENIVSDPTTTKAQRRVSIRKLLGFLIDVATTMGYTSIFGLSQHPQMVKTCKEFGFQSTNAYTLLVLNERQEEE